LTKEFVTNLKVLKIIIENKTMICVAALAIISLTLFNEGHAICDINDEQLLTAKNPYIPSLFETKHVSTTILPNPPAYLPKTPEDIAKEHSCERNRLMKKFKKPNAKAPTGVNSVLFNPIGNYITPTSGAADRCVKEFQDLYHCTGVPTKIYTGHETSLNVAQCHGQWTIGKGCSSCKIAYPNARTFHVEILKNSGHFLNEDVKYEDNSGNLFEIDTGCCLPFKQSSKEQRRVGCAPRRV